MKYYYSGKLLEDLLIQIANSSAKEILAEVTSQVDAYRQREDHWEGKRKLISQVTSLSAYIVFKLFLFSAGKKQSIQALIAPMIGVIAEKGMSYEDSVRVASWFIQAGSGKLYKLVRTHESLMVESNYTFDEEEKEAESYMMYPPPEGEVQEVDYRLLGHSLNNHDGYIPYDIIELLQAIEWRLDPYICSMPEEANSVEFETRDQELQWMEHKEQAKRLRDSLIGKPMYFKWRYEKRLRQFMQGHHITLQGIKYKKAVMTFGKPYKIEGDL